MPLIALASLTATSGCRSLMHSVESPEATKANLDKAAVRKPEHLSPETWTVLRYWDLHGAYRRNPERTLREAMQLFRDHPDREWAVALAELSYRAGEAQEESTRRRQATLMPVSFSSSTNVISAEEHYLNSVSYAYYFLFAEGKPINEFDRRVSTACSFYNAGLEKCLRLARRQGRFLPQKALRMDTSTGAIACQVEYKGFVWRPDEFNELMFVRELRPADTPRPQESLGLGVPLIALRHRHDDGDDRERFLVKRHPFAVTAFFRPDLTRLTPYQPVNAVVQTSHEQPALLDQAEDRHVGVLELYDPLRITEIPLNGMSVPLEADLSAPMEFALRDTRNKKFEWGGFFDPDSVQDFSGLYMIEPYQPGKIPIICVHGLLSGPLTWNGMFEALWSDPKIRENYQMWFFLYPTGAPFLASARKLRQEIEEIEQMHGDDPASLQMVLVGHSMGGLLSKLQVTESDDKLWNLVSRKPIDELKTDDETRHQLQQTYYFEPQPAVKRVIYIATPHRGSELSDAPVGRIGSWLVQVPKKLKNTRKQLVQDNPGTFDGRFAAGNANSVDMLSYNNPVLQTMYELPYEDGVHLHSIIGTKNENVIGNKGHLALFLTGDRNEEGDGVVPRKSARLPTAESEAYVPTTHDKVHRHPLAYQEVNRILRIHLRDTERQPQSTVSPLSEEHTPAELREPMLQGVE